jgi:hypothetical protein
MNEQASSKDLHYIKLNCKCSCQSAFTKGQQMQEKKLQSLQNRNASLCNELVDNNASLSNAYKYDDEFHMLLAKKKEI